MWLNVNTNAQHVIFKAVGQMVKSVNYIHCKFTLDLSSIEEQQAKFDEALSLMSKTMKIPKIPKSKLQTQLSSLFKTNFDQAMEVFTLFR